jgi:hypothetical protein
VKRSPYFTAASDVYLPPAQAFLDELERDARQRLNDLLFKGDRVEFKTETVVNVGDPLTAIVEYARARPPI